MQADGIVITQEEQAKDIPEKAQPLTTDVHKLACRTAATDTLPKLTVNTIRVHFRKVKFLIYALKD